MDSRKVYQSAGLVVLVLVLLATWLKSRYNLSHNYVLYGVVVFGLILFSVDRFTVLFVDKWMQFGRLLGNINAGIILSLVYIVLVLPISLLQKISDKVKSSDHSNWDEAEDKLNFRNPW